MARNASEVAIVFTTRCTTDCEHCGFSCRPGAGEDLDLAVAISFCREALASAKRLGKPLQVSLSGGEPFLRYGDLLALGAAFRDSCESIQFSCMTNGFWAESVSRAKEILQPLQEVGWRHFGISIDDFHVQKVGLRRIRNAVEGLMELGFVFCFKFTKFRSKRGLAACLSDFADIFDRNSNAIFDVHAFSAIASGRARTLSEEHFFFLEGLPKGACGAGKMTLMPDGRLIACCSSFGSASRLVLGRYPEQTFRELEANYQQSELLRTLFIEGPAYFAPFLEAAGVPPKQGRYTHLCDLCREVVEEGLDDPCRTAAIQEAVTAWCAERDFECNTLLPLLQPFLEEAVLEGVGS